MKCLAEEKMYKAYIQYSKELENNILERILHCKPEIFLNGWWWTCLLKWDMDTIISLVKL